jgi:hypothetical protein
MGAFMAKIGEDTEEEGTAGDQGGTAQGFKGDGMGDGGAGGPNPNPNIHPDADGGNAPPAGVSRPYIAPATAFSAPPQQTDIQNNFSTANQYQQRYGLAGRIHF